MQSVHKPVLLNEIIGFLASPEAQAEIDAGNKSDIEKETPWYVDGTLGGAGHAIKISEAMRGKIKIIGFDRDMDAVKRARETLSGKAEEIILECANYRDMDTVLDKHGIGSVQMILLDLGISSDELDNSGRGFTFRNDEPLLMTMGDPAGYQFTASVIVNDWSEETLADIIYGYGEDRFARRIARAIVGYRTKKRIETSGELAELVKMSVPAFARNGKIHPATKTFQALRIAVNDELNSLKEGLSEGYSRLEKGGRMAVISFHSLEDRIVKNFYKEKAKSGAHILTKKPIRPSDQEIEENPRSRSAKLRIISK